MEDFKRSVRPARSVLGSYSGRVNIGKDDILIALRAYLDSSGKLEDDHITLAALAANDDMWGEFDTEWDKILTTNNPPAKYVHMREIFRLIKEFDSSKGWDHQKAFGLSNKCLSYMSLLDKKRFRMFYCTVDLNAWRKLRTETYPLPDPIDMCNKFCSEAVLTWYLHYYPEVIDIHNDAVKYFFDRNEDFYQPFHNKWNAEKKLSDDTGEWSVWNLIDQVTDVEMRKTPGIQAADIIAWGMNRETFAQDGEIASHLGYIIRTVIPAFHVVWDEAKMRQHYKPLIYLS